MALSSIRASIFRSNPGLGSFKVQLQRIRLVVLAAMEALYVPFKTLFCSDFDIVR